MTHKNRKKCRIFMFGSAGCSLLRAEGFSCSLGVLYGGLGISKLQLDPHEINAYPQPCRKLPCQQWLDLCCLSS
jgi:hypothetical protein